MSRLLIFLVQTAIFGASVAIAFFLRFDLSFPSDEMAHFIFALVVCIVVKNFIFHLGNERSVPSCAQTLTPHARAAKWPRLVTHGGALLHRASHDSS